MTIEHDHAGFGLAVCGGRKTTGDAASYGRRRSARLARAYIRLPAAGAVVAVLTALLTAPLPTEAQTCTPAGTGAPPTVTYDDASYTDGISCTGIRGGLTLTVAPPPGGTVITGQQRGIHVSDTNRVSGAISVDVGAGTRIGTQDNPMGLSGIEVEIQGSPTSANTAGISIVNAGSITTGRTGINVNRHSVGDVTVTNSGNIVSSNPDDSVREGGITVHTRKPGHVVINNPGSVTSGWHAAIYAWYEGTAAADAGSVEVASSGAVRSMAKHGILAQVTDAAVPAAVTLTGGTVHGTDDGIRVANEGSGSSTARVSGTAMIESSNEDGIHASAGHETNDESRAAVLVDFGSGSTIVTRNLGGEEDESSHGIHAEHFGNQARGEGATDTGSIAIRSAGAVRTAGNGSPGHGIAAFATGTSATVPIVVDVTGGSVTAADDGIHVENLGTGRIAVTVGEQAQITAERDGVDVDGALLQGGLRAQTVTVRGKVMGGGGTHAGVHMVEGGTIVVGPKAHVSAKSGVAIKANAEGDMTVILEKDEDGLVGNIEGRIVNAQDKATTFRIRAEGESGMGEELAANGMVDVRGETRGVYDGVQRAKLLKVTDGYGFEKSEARLYHDRARVYEALPSVLLGLNGQTSYGARMAAPRGGNGAWARFEAGGRAREAAGSATSRGLRGKALAWDFEHWGLEAGFDMPVAGDDLLLGVSLHRRQGDAVVKSGGKIGVSGTGLSLSAAFESGDGLYADGQVSYTRFDDIDLTSNERGALTSGLSGSGYGVGLEAGKRMALGGVALTPRGGIAWSSVDADSFDDLSGSGKVSLGKARSFRGRLGVLAETGFGGTEAGDAAGAGRAFASLDVEHEFSPERDITASGTVLASEVEATWVRLGLGGAVGLDAAGMVLLSGKVFYGTAGSGNADYGAGVALGMRF